MLTLAGSALGLPPAGSAALHPEASALGSVGVINFHVHKAGGSSICQMAARNGERVTSENCNLLYENYGFNCDKAASVARTAAQQEAYLATAAVTFGANECCAPRELPRGVVHMAALREPLERAASHFYFDQALSPNQLPDGGPASFNEWVLTTMGTTEYSTYYWHNYMTRYFSSTTHTNDIGEHELQLAKSKLEAIDLLIDLDDFESSMSQLRAALPHWADTSLPHANDGGGQSRVVSLSPEAHEKLVAANALDTELYEHFRKTAALRRAQLLARRAESLPGWVGGSNATASALSNATFLDAVPRHVREFAFFNDSVRLVVTASPAGGVYR